MLHRAAEVTNVLQWPSADGLMISSSCSAKLGTWSLFCKWPSSSTGCTLQSLFCSWRHEGTLTLLASFVDRDGWSKIHQNWQIAPKTQGTNATLTRQGYLSISPPSSVYRFLLNGKAYCLFISPHSARFPLPPFCLTFGEGGQAVILCSDSWFELASNTPIWNTCNIGDLFGSIAGYS